VITPLLYQVITISSNFNEYLFGLFETLPEDEMYKVVQPAELDTALHPIEKSRVVRLVQNLGHVETIHIEELAQAGTDARSSFGLIRGCTP